MSSKTTKKATVTKLTEEPKPLKVQVVGVGGVGSWLAEGIVRILEWSRPGSILVLIDGDGFEHRNSERQSFSELGNKAEVKAAELAPLFPRTYVVASPRWVVPDVEGDEMGMSDTKVAVKRLVEDGDVIFATVDNFAARKHIFDAATSVANIDVFTGGNDDAYFGSLYHYSRRNGNDLIDHPSEWHPEFVNPPDKNPGSLSCEERARIEGGTQLIGLNMAVAAMLLARFHKMLVHGDLAHSESEIFFDIGLGMMGAYDRRVGPDAATNSIEEVLEVSA